MTTPVRSIEISGLGLGFRLDGIVVGYAPFNGGSGINNDINIADTIKWYHLPLSRWINEGVLPSDVEKLV